MDITGEGGLLQRMMKSMLEAALAEELTDHLGYEQRRPGRRRGSGNSRNGVTSKRRCSPTPGRWGAGLLHGTATAVFEPLDRAHGAAAGPDGIDKIVLWSVCERA